jgi:hypothetical protein
MHDLLKRVLGRPVPLTRFAPDIHLSAEEMEAPLPGTEGQYWVIIAGGKRDMTTKWWPSESYQQVVDALQGRVRFVQAGHASDHHPVLRNCTHRVGATTLREFVRLIYHAQGVVCPVTCAMHIAAAFDKPCVVIAGGREPPHWEMYPSHQFLHTVGQLSCCRTTGCWKARVTPLHDGDVERDRSLCKMPSQSRGQPVAACMKLIEPRDVVRSIERYLVHEVPSGAGLTAENAPERMSQAALSIPEYPGGFAGRGIVIPSGGPKYFPCAWVNINMLRDLGCHLPIELWHLGSREMTDETRRLVEPLGVRCVDALEVRKTHPVRTLGGWELKPYAMLHTAFREVLLLDADNVPVRDPTYLFDDPNYVAHGAVFWPDYGRLARDRAIWDLTGVAYRDEPEFESGQIFVDKSRCWAPLSLTMWMNEHSDFWYRHIHGDKDTFHLAWRKLGFEYAMPCLPIHSLPGVMCQHDFQGRRLFQHRNFAKWTLTGENPRINDFWLEDCCLSFLTDLRARWGGKRTTRYQDDQATPDHRAIARELCQSDWTYRRVGFDHRKMIFDLSGKIATGAAGCEQSWQLRSSVQPDIPRLEIYGSADLTCVLYRVATDVWKGHWICHERMPVELRRQTGDAHDKQAL